MATPWAVMTQALGLFSQWMPWREETRSATFGVSISEKNALTQKMDENHPRSG
jgi:hypothetical protein